MQITLAKKYQVTPTTISTIVRGKIWKRLVVTETKPAKVFEEI